MWTRRAIAERGQRHSLVHRSPGDDSIRKQVFAPAEMEMALLQAEMAAALEAAAAADGLSGTGSWAPADSIEAAVEGADAVLILTEWRQYRDLNWVDLAARMRKPAWVFDARAVTQPAEVKAAGLRLWRVGDGEA